MHRAPVCSRSGTWLTESAAHTCRHVGTWVYHKPGVPSDLMPLPSPVQWPVTYGSADGFRSRSGAAKTCFFIPCTMAHHHPSSPPTSRMALTPPSVCHLVPADRCPAAHRAAASCGSQQPQLCTVQPAACSGGMDMPLDPPPTWSITAPSAHGAWGVGPGTWTGTDHSPLNSPMLTCESWIKKGPRRQPSAPRSVGHGAALSLKSRRGRPVHWATRPPWRLLPAGRGAGGLFWRKKAKKDLGQHAQRPPQRTAKPKWRWARKSGPVHVERPGRHTRSGSVHWCGAEKPLVEQRYVAPPPVIGAGTDGCASQASVARRALRRQCVGRPRRGATRKKECAAHADAPCDGVHFGAPGASRRAPDQ